MNVATVVMVVEGLLLAVALVFVVALLRSHAGILRRLAALEGSDLPGAHAGRSAIHGVAAPSANARDLGVTVGEVAGETLVGDAVKVSLGPGSPRTLLAFLSSGCTACGPLWDGLGSASMPPGVRLVVVTKGPERESLARLQALAGRREVVMSTAAWQDFQVPATPHFVLVDGDEGAIVGRGGANSWEQLSSLLSDARRDSDLHRARGTSARAARAESALAAAGISAGHPSLYPSRDSGSEGSDPGAVA